MLHQPVQKLTGTQNGNDSKFLEFQQMRIAADYIFSVPGDCSFEKFVIFGIRFNKPDAFLGDDKFGKLVAVADDAVNGDLFEPEFGTIEDFEIFNQNVACDKDGKGILGPFVQNQFRARHPARWK